MQGVTFKTFIIGNTQYLMAVSPAHVGAQQQMWVAKMDVTSHSSHNVLQECSSTSMSSPLHQQRPQAKAVNPGNAVLDYLAYTFEKFPVASSLANYPLSLHLSIGIAAHAATGLHDAGTATVAMPMAAGGPGPVTLASGVSAAMCAKVVPDQVTGSTVAYAQELIHQVRTRTNKHFQGCRFHISCGIMSPDGSWEQPEMVPCSKEVPLGT